MKLEYHKGANVGDAINPIVFNYYLPELLNNDDSEILLGIGSILGLKRPRPDQKVIVFSSGYADGAPDTYGEIPKIDDKYEILCVRGPLTAKALGLPGETAVADGAILLKDIPNLITTKKTGKIGFIPHVGSLNFYDSKELITKLGFLFIDPRDEPIKVLNAIASCEKIIAEAMHGAIIADTFRVPWIPIKCYTTINDFKWNDYCASMQIEYKPLIINSLYSRQAIASIFEGKFKANSKFLLNILASIYLIIQNLIIINLLKIKLRKAAKARFQLSKTDILNKKHEQLLEILNKFRNKQCNEGLL